MKGKRSTAELRMMNMRRQVPTGKLNIKFLTLFRTLDRKAVDMLSAKVKEKANALKEYLKERPEAEF